MKSPAEQQALQQAFREHVSSCQRCREDVGELPSPDETREPCPVGAELAKKSLLARGLPEWAELGITPRTRSKS